MMEPALGRPNARRTAAATARVRVAPSARTIARRRITVGFLKWLLPAAGVALLVLLAVWPEFANQAESGRIAFRRVAGGAPESAALSEARYRGVDENGRPFTITASSVEQLPGNRFVLTTPRADLGTADGAWVLIESRRGNFTQGTQELDLSQDVTIWHDNGMRLQTPSASIDLRAGAAIGAEPVQAQGPFGTLESEGFSMLDRGAIVVFTGRARLVLESDR